MMLLNSKAALNQYWARQDALPIEQPPEPEPVKTKTQLLIDELATSPATTEELSLATGIPQSTCASLVTVLKQRGRVAPFGIGRSSRGFRMTIWQVAPHSTKQPPFLKDSKP